jgi:hypothetical protein
MAQDVDIARVATALNAPGLRYRSFGNEPVRAPAPPEAKGAVTISALSAEAGSTTEGLRSHQDASPTMNLIANALSGTVPIPPPVAGAVASGAPLAAPPTWPLLEALKQAAEQGDGDQGGRGTLVRLFGGAPAPTAAAMPTASIGPFPGSWAPASALPPGPEAGGLAALGAATTPVPAERVTLPLADVFHALARGVAAPASPFAALRLPGNGAGPR